MVHCTYNCLFSMELRALVAVAEVADNASSTSGGSSSRSRSENKTSSSSSNYDNPDDLRHLYIYITNHACTIFSLQYMHKRNHSG